MSMNNSELSRYCHANDERRETRDDLKVEEEFQGGREKFQRGWKGSPIGLLCSRNARPEKALVRRAQWWIKPGRPPGGDTGSSE